MPVRPTGGFALQLPILPHMVAAGLVIGQELLHKRLFLLLVRSEAGVVVAVVCHYPALLEVARQLLAHVTALVMVGRVQGTPHLQQLQVLLESRCECGRGHIEPLHPSTASSCQLHKREVYLTQIYNHSYLQPLWPSHP